MVRPRSALSFENVLVTLVAFLALSGGVAYAAGHLGKNSVGKKQLKASSVTAAKIKAKAVTAAKIKSGAVTSPKVKDGTIGAAAFDPSGNPFSGIVQTATSTGTATQPNPTIGSEPIQVPLTNNTFTQMPGETIYAIGQFHWSTTGKCGAGSKKFAFYEVYYDTPSLNPEPGSGREVADGSLFDTTATAPASGDLPITSFDEGSIPPPASPTSRTLTMFFGAFCEGMPSSMSTSDVTLDVLGVK